MIRASAKSRPFPRGWVLSVAIAACTLLGACSLYDKALLDAGQQPVRRDSGMPSEDASALADAAVSDCANAEDYSVCESANANGLCIAGSCTIVRCAPGYFDCDADAVNGCETTLESPEHCGACGARCRLSHVSSPRCEPAAEAGPCTIDHDCSSTSGGECIQSDPTNGCEPGYGDCDGVAANGCEASLATLSDCGRCAASCGFETAEASCESGSCQAIGCKTNFADCGSGCTSLIDSAEHCGRCDRPCNAPNECSGGRCTAQSCAPGLADCDEDAETGCEADLSRPESCGSCGSTCGPYSNAQAGCTAGQCAIAGCSRGFASCNGAREDGCETDLSKVASCGRCGNDCEALPRVAGAQCTGGQCSALTCESGWGNCDGNPANGCEQPLNTLDHCGSCSARCDPSHATGSCASGRCQLRECDPGYDDCNDSAADGCEANLAANGSCGTCGNRCASDQVCRSGGCACAGGTCANGNTCCSGTCIDTRSACFPWPCIPGTARDGSNCGGCGTSCFGWCCST